MFRDTDTEELGIGFRQVRHLVICGLVMALITSGCLSDQNGRNTTIDTSCNPEVQTELVSNKELNRSEESPRQFESLSQEEQKLFLRALNHTSYEVENISDATAEGLGNDIVRYQNSTYRVIVRVC